MPDYRGNQLQDAEALQMFMKPVNEGIQRGMDRGLEQQKIELSRRQQLADFLQKGVSPDAGGLNGYGQDVQKTAMAGNEFTREGYDPNSQRGTATRSTLAGIGGKFGMPAPDANLAPADAEKVQPTLEAGIKGAAEEASARFKQGNVVDKTLQHDQDTLNKNLQPLIKKQQDSADVKSQLALAHNGNGIAANTVPILLDRFQTQSARGLSPQLIQRYGSSPEIAVRFKNAIDEASQGKLAPENEQFLREIIDEGDKNLDKALYDTKMRHAQQRAARYKSGVDREWTSLTGEPYSPYQPPAAPASNYQSPPPSGVNQPQDQGGGFLNAIKHPIDSLGSMLKPSPQPQSGLPSIDAIRAEKARRAGKH